MRHPESGAFAELAALTRDPHQDARVDAVDLLATLAANEELVGPLAPKAALVLQCVAVEERAFLPRFLALRYLAHSGEPLPTYDRDQVVAFAVSFGKARRTIEVGADQTLLDLHHALLDAFGWDTDHLHCFSLNGELRDPRFCIPVLTVGHRLLRLPLRLRRLERLPDQGRGRTPQGPADEVPARHGQGAVCAVTT